MTLNANAARNEYTAGASQTIFNYTFKIYETTDLDVYVTPAGQECSDSDLTTSYSVAGVGAEDGGSITLTTPTSSGDLVTIVSSIPTNRTTDYQNNGDFRPDTVNDDFDRTVSLVKQAEEAANRSLVFADCLQNATSLSLPAPESERLVRWKSDLSGLENTDPPSAVVTDTTLVSTRDYGTLRVVTGQVSDQVVSVAYRLSENDGGGGSFRWDDSDLSTEVTADALSGIYVAPLSDLTGASGAWVRGDVLAGADPRFFGAIFNNSADIGPYINAILALGFTAIIPSQAAVINTQVDILDNSHIVFIGSQLRTTSEVITMFSASSVDGWSITGSCTLIGTAASGQSNQIGIDSDGCKRYKVENVTSQLMKGWSFRISDDGVVDDRSEHGSWNNCTAYDSWVGWEFEDGTSAEYTVLTGCSAINNVTGVINGAGNTNWSGGNIVDNGVGIELYGGSNDNHGIFSGVNINHNTTTITANDTANGYTFSGCHFYGSAIDGAINITNCAQMDFDGGTLACTVSVNAGAGTKNGINIFRNMYLNVPAWTGFGGDDLDNLITRGLYSNNGLEVASIYSLPPARVVDNAGFQNSWADFGSGRLPLSYHVDEGGWVHVSGVINGGTTTFGTIVTSLPASLHPNFIHEFICTQGTAGGVASIQVDLNGDIVWINGANSQVGINISYPLVG